MGHLHELRKQLLIGILKANHIDVGCRGSSEELRRRHRHYRRMYSPEGIDDCAVLGPRNVFQGKITTMPRGIPRSSHDVPWGAVGRSKRRDTAGGRVRDQRARRGSPGQLGDYEIVKSEEHCSEWNGSGLVLREKSARYFYS
jgi:hypothetical protein